MTTNTSDLPCDCRHCHVCAILGIAYPVASRASEQIVQSNADDAGNDPGETKQARIAQPSLFDEIETGEMESCPPANQS